MFIEDDFIELNSKFHTACKPASRIVTLLSVPILLFVAVVLCYFGILPLKVEIHSVILIGIILFIYLFFVRHNAYYVSCKFKTQYEDCSNSLKEYINKNLLNIGNTTKANGSVDDFLQDYTSNIRNTNLSTIASGIFPTLGILGTFISIALSMPDFTEGTTQALESEITTLLGGVGTAFYVSIYGIFLSIWWVFFEKFGMSRFERDSYIIKENTKSFFWTRIDIETIHIKSNLDNFTKMNNIFEQLTSAELINSINHSMELRFKALDELLNKEYLVATKLNTNVKSLNNLTEDISKTISNFEKQRELYDASSELLNENIVRLSVHMENLSSENLKAIYTNIVKSIETMKSDMEKIEWKFQKALDEYDNKMTNNLKSSLEMIDSQTTKIVKDLSEFKEISR